MPAVVEHPQAGRRDRRGEQLRLVGHDDVVPTASDDQRRNLEGFQPRSLGQERAPAAGGPRPQDELCQTRGSRQGDNWGARRPGSRSHHLRR